MFALGKTFSAVRTQKKREPLAFKFKKLWRKPFFAQLILNDVRLQIGMLSLFKAKSLQAIFELLFAYTKITHHRGFFEALI